VQRGGQRTSPIMPTKCCRAGSDANACFPCLPAALVHARLGVLRAPTLCLCVCVCVLVCVCVCVWLLVAASPPLPACALSIRSRPNLHAHQKPTRSTLLLQGDGKLCGCVHPNSAWGVRVPSGAGVCAGRFEAKSYHLSEDSLVRILRISEQGPCTGGGEASPPSSAQAGACVAWGLRVGSWSFTTLQAACLKLHMLPHLHTHVNLRTWSCSFTTLLHTHVGRLTRVRSRTWSWSPRSATSQWRRP